MAFKAVPAIKELAADHTVNAAVQKEVIGSAVKLWRRIGLIILILFTILVALAVNSLVQSLFASLSPDKEEKSIVLLLVSQSLYLMVVTIGMVAAIVLLARADVKEALKIKTNVVAPQTT